MARKKNQKARDKNHIASLQAEVNKLEGKVKALSVQPTNVKRQRKKARKAKALVASGTFGPVSSITTAPVAIGNSVKGSSKKLTRTANGVRIRGRDFMFAPIGTGSVVTWTACGGSPLTPAAFADSVIANYQRMYMKFKFHSFVAHYITSSPTSANGDVLFYYSKDRTSVFLNQTSSQLLPFVLTDENTVLGPQWTNHSANFKVTGDWKLTDYGMHDGVEEYADGELFLLSKTTTTDSPGYVIFDYDIEFAQESFQPRLLTFPIPRIQWNQLNVGLVTTAVTKDSTNVVVGLIGNNISGAASAFPTGFTMGDIYKVIVDVTNSTPGSWVNCTPSNLYDYENFSSNPLNIQDGSTIYAVANDATHLQFYASPTGAFATNEFFRYGVSATITYNLQIWISYIGCIAANANNPDY